MTRSASSSVILFWGDQLHDNVTGELDVGAGLQLLSGTVQCTGRGLPDTTAGLDLDGDGYPQSDDCDDSDASANPGLAEVCGDRIDNDCDGYVDDFDNDCIGSAGDKSCASVSPSSAGPALLVLAVVAAGRRRRDRDDT